MALTETDEAARRFAEHCQECEVCATNGPELCDDGLKLMLSFHATLVGPVIKCRKDVN